MSPIPKLIIPDTAELTRLSSTRTPTQLARDSALRFSIYYGFLAGTTLVCGFIAAVLGPTRVWLPLVLAYVAFTILVFTGCCVIIRRESMLARFGRLPGESDP